MYGIKLKASAAECAEIRVFPNSLIACIEIHLGKA